MKHSLFSIIFLLIANFSYAQKGSITGLLLDESDLPLIGATVQVKGLSYLGTISDNNGKFILVNVPEGKQEIEISYLGFETYKETIDLAAGQELDLKRIQMKGNFILGDEVVILGTNLQGQAKALGQQKNANNIVNVISADQVGKFPDSNVGDALKRVPGITMQYDQGEARFGLIRGTSPDLSAITINGERVPSAEGETRAVQLDLIPADMIQSIEVSKTLTPDMDADAIGGSANLVLRSAPSNLRVSGTLGTGYNFLTEKPMLNGAIVLGNRFFDDKLGVIVSSSYFDHQLGSHNIEAEWDDADNPYMTDFQVRTYDVHRIRRSLSTTLDYTLGTNSKIYVSGIYNHRDDRENRYRLRYKDIEMNDDGSYTAEIRRQTKGGLDDNNNKNTRLEDQRTYNVTLGGEHLLANRFKLDWSGTLAKASEERPHERYISWRQKDVGLSQDLTSTRQPNINDNGAGMQYGDFDLKEITQEQQYTEELDKNAKINLEIPLNNTKNKSIIKIGGRYRGKEKSRNNGYMEYAPLDEAPFGNMTLQPMKDQTRDPFLAGNYTSGNFTDATALGQYDLTNTSLFEATDLPEEYLGGNYNAKEQISAGYAMLKQSVGTKWFFIVGARIENTQVDYTGYQIEFNEEGDFDPSATKTIEGTNSYTNFLPNVQARYNINENTILRAAWTNTLARPRYYDLVPYRSISREDNELSEGNPNLKPTTSMNFDFMAEHYFENVGILSGGVFQKTLNDFIYDYQARNYQDPASGNVYDRYSQPRNGAKASLLGTEVAFQYPFTGALKGFALYTNYTYTHSEIQDLGIEEREDETLALPGTAPHTVNGSLSFDSQKFSFRISLNYTAAYLDELSDEAFKDRYYDQQLFLDANASYAFNEKLRLYVEGNNLLNTPLRYYQGFEEYTMQSEYYNARVQLGLKFDLSK
ncbi:TonB-dependent receptor [Flammeovirga agarivorans]|uniref:TonB-dependent receptor n=1 Tax=Flammeovirga agarivorans TaxID=2726742 RepID=A0A7X8SGZ5_9BACT|nr:TonB-dependent receptor [Flammeovirga agarivorans]NLR90036.1 TonB-dependent receptor [Flammeovirga agarivorans]